EIVVPDFDARRLLHEEGLGPDLLGTLRQLSWTYPLEGSELQVVSTWDTTRPAHPPRHLLHVGPAVAWVLPDAVGQRLQGWLARCEEGTERPDLPRGDGGVRPGRAPVESADPQALRAALVQGQQARWEALAQYLRHLPVVTRDHFELATCLLHDIHALV